ncbi:MAG: hypothetical protein HOL37_10775 [Rhodospirillaceae bacterium]|jgi:hypothetical protein|nr:hypothetical protein [Rhodospirillaceae bacterium]MBT4464087.1 hypothetical protein [Rhodospirillaceae bacterium]MBT5309808.1 hypothetical protein [Rhodospirillaceae bacterium]MBT7355336.1 hypothetical protein [Rhodospirillaceae bacterium]
MNRIYRSYFMTFWALFLAGTVLAFAAVELVDPKGENDFSIGLERNYFSSVLNAQRQLQTLSVRPSAVIFGTSRSAYLSPDVIGTSVINMQVIYANPHAVLDFLGRLDDTQISNITEIYYLLDYFTFNGERNYDRVDYESTVERLVYKIKSLGLGKIQLAWQKIINNLTDSDMSYVTVDGYLMAISENTFDGKVGGEPYPQDFQEDTVGELSKVDAFAKQHGVAITYFMAPFPEATLGRLDFGRHALFSRSVLKHIDGFYDWTYVESMSRFADQFSDGAHVKYALLKRLFQELRTPEYYVDGGNVGTHLKKLRPHFDKVDLR